MTKYLDSIGLSHLVKKIKEHDASISQSLTNSMNSISQNLTNSMDAKLATKAESTHSHSTSDITSGTLAVSRGGTGVTTDAAIGLKAYPVGAVYISYVSTSPASLFGGSWTAITGRFPYFNAGTDTGGSNTHTLTEYEMPNHRHPFEPNVLQEVSSGGGLLVDYGSAAGIWKGSNLVGDFTAGCGGGGAHNNMPAYQTLYAWRRTA